MHGLVEQIKEHYERFADEVFEICFEKDEYREIVHPKFPVYKAEIVYFIRKQHAYKLDDMLTRRFSIRYMLADIAEHKEIIEKTARVMQQECGWSEDVFLSETQNMIKQVEERLYVIFD